MERRAKSLTEGQLKHSTLQREILRDRGTGSVFRDEMVLNLGAGEADALLGTNAFRPTSFSGSRWVTGGEAGEENIGNDGAHRGKKNAYRCINGPYQQGSDDSASQRLFTPLAASAAVDAAAEDKVLHPSQVLGECRDRHISDGSVCTPADECQGLRAFKRAGPAATTTTKMRWTTPNLAKPRMASSLKTGEGDISRAIEGRISKPGVMATAATGSIISQNPIFVANAELYGALGNSLPATESDAMLSSKKGPKRRQSLSSELTGQAEIQQDNAHRATMRPTITADHLLQPLPKHSESGRETSAHKISKKTTGALTRTMSKSAVVLSERELNVAGSARPRPAPRRPLELLLDDCGSRVDAKPPLSAWVIDEMNRLFGVRGINENGGVVARNTAAGGAAHEYRTYLDHCEEDGSDSKAEEGARNMFSGSYVNNDGLCRSIGRECGVVGEVNPFKVIRSEEGRSKGARSLGSGIVGSWGSAVFARQFKNAVNGGGRGGALEGHTLQTGDAENDVMHTAGVVPVGGNPLLGDHHLLSQGEGTSKASALPLEAVSFEAAGGTVAAVAAGCVPKPLLSAPINVLYAGHHHEVVTGKVGTPPCVGSEITGVASEPLPGGKAQVAAQLAGVPPPHPQYQQSPIFEGSRLPVPFNSRPTDQEPTGCDVPATASSHNLSCLEHRALLPRKISPDLDIQSRKSFEISSLPKLWGKSGLEEVHPNPGAEGQLHERSIDRTNLSCAITPRSEDIDAFDGRSGGCCENCTGTWYTSTDCCDANNAVDVAILGQTSSVQGRLTPSQDIQQENYGSQTMASHERHIVGTPPLSQENCQATEEISDNTVLQRAAVPVGEGFSLLEEKTLEVGRATSTFLFFVTHIRTTYFRVPSPTHLLQIAPN